MSLVLGTESRLTPKRLRSLWVAQARDDQLIEQGHELLLLPPAVWASARSLEVALLRALLGSREAAGFLRMGPAPHGLPGRHSCLLEKASRDPSGTTAFLLLAKSGGAVGRRPVTGFISAFIFFFLYHMVHPDIIPADKQLGASAATSMGNSGTGCRALPLGREGSAKSILTGQQKLYCMKAIQIHSRANFPNQLSFPRFPKRIISGSYSGGSSDN